MTTASTATESNKDITPPSQTSDDFGYGTPANVDPSVPSDTAADLGYDDVPATPPAPPAPPVVKTADVEPPKDDVKPEDKKITGYGDDEDKPEPPKEETPPKEDVKPEELTEEQKAHKEIDEVVKTIGEGYDKDKISKFAKDNKMSKAQVEAYVKLTQDEQKEFVAKEKERVATQRKAWKKELMDDPEFGGEHFDRNVDRVGKVLNNYMPNFKKQLTDKGGMLPPYLMKDLLSLDKQLNPKPKFNGGEPPAPAQDEDNYLEEMYPNMT